MDRLRNEELRRGLIKGSLKEKKVKKTRLKWFVDLKRMKEDSTPRKINKLVVNGNRPRGWLRSVIK